MKDIISHYITERFSSKIEDLGKEYSKELAKATTEASINDVEAKFAAKRDKLKTDFTPENWLDNAATRASQISMATHAIKFTHSSAKGSNILAQNLGNDPRYLDTQSLSQPAIDAVGNAAALDVAALLQLTENNGRSLLDYLKHDDVSPLRAFTDNREKLQTWLEGFKQALNDAKPSSHTLGKQVYFPMREGEHPYHLLAPLHSSSLSQALYQRVNDCRYSQEMKAVRDARKAQQPHPGVEVFFPNLAVTISGGSKPQNVSKLNSGRGGRNYLFSAEPPKWQSQPEYPLHYENIFTHPQLRFATRGAIKSLVNWRIKLNTSNENGERIHSNNKHNRQRFVQLSMEIIEIVLFVAMQWQQLPSGWSDESKTLPETQSRWLDPHNPKWDRHDDRWQSRLAERFALWLVGSVNRQTKEQFIVGVNDQQQWQKMFKKLLQEMGE